MGSQDFIWGEHLKVVNMTLDKRDAVMQSHFCISSCQALNVHLELIFLLVKEEKRVRFTLRLILFE